MGNRHQLFVIAKVGGRYRSLAAHHHQWLYSDWVLERCNHLIKIFQESKNREMINLEISRAARLGDDVWKVKEPDTPEFPFITTCLIVGTSIDIDMVWNKATRSLPWNLDFDGGDNNDGVTILDITDPANVRYGFIPDIPSWYDRDRGIKPKPIVSTGKEYLQNYYDSFTHNGELFESKGDKVYKEDKPSERTLRVVKELEKIPLLQTRDLHEIWPRDWLYREDGRDAMSPPDTSHKRVLVRSLVDMSIEKAIQELLMCQGDEIAQLTAGVEDLPIFLPTLRSYLRLHPDVVAASPSGVALLRKAYRGSPSLDLSVFVQLTGEQLVELCGDFNELDFLDISGNHNISFLDVSKLSKTTSITQLYVWDNNQLSLSDIASLKGPKLREIVHRDVFLAGFKDNDTTDPTISSRKQNGIDRTGLSNPSTPSASLNLSVTGHQFAQLIFLRWGGDPYEEPETSVKEFLEPENGAQMYLPEATLREVWRKAKLAAMPLDDMTCSTSEILIFITRLIRFAAPNRFRFPMENLPLIATLRDVESSLAVKYVPPKAYRLVDYWDLPSPPTSSSISPLALDQWSVLLIQDPKRLFLYLAFLTMNPDGNMRTCSAADFMKETGQEAGVRNIWNKELRKVRPVPKFVKGEFLEWQKVKIVNCKETMVRNFFALVDATIESDNAQREKRDRMQLA